MDFAAGCLPVWGPLPSYDPLHTVYVYLFTQGRGKWGGGGRANQREGQRGNRAGIFKQSMGARHRVGIGLVPARQAT